jgi:hypothetical protein
MKDKKTKKLKWDIPVLECFDKSKISRGADCGSGSGPGGGLDNCKDGALANGCSNGTTVSPI